MKLILGIVLLSLTACIGIGPRSIHAPLLEEKGDLHAGVFINPTTGLEVQADYAWADKFYSPVDVGLFTNTQTRAFTTSIGIGYYVKNKKKLHFNAYFIPMYSVFKGEQDSRNRMISESIGFDVGHKFKHFESAFSLKLQAFQYQGSFGGFEGLSTNIEPGLTMRFGGERFKFQMQMGVSYPIIDKSNFLAYTLNMGLTYRINIFNKESSK